jgi:anti-anti-sigma regulatory factor/anti-sigma regulatory factor (Ser/Thr protein kinase)
MGGVLVPDALACQVSRIDGYVVLRLRGELTVRTGPKVRGVLRTLLLDRARVLVDLAGLTADSPAAVAVFPAALAATGGWPSARLVLFGAGERMADALRRGGTVRSVPLAATREAAEDLLHHRPERVIRCADLPADPYAASLARALIADACADWDLADRYDRAALIGTELVTNAVEHTGAPSSLVLVVDRADLAVAVRDTQPVDEARLRRFGDTSLPGRGLLLVAGLSRIWGVTRHRYGKTVWARLALTGHPAAPRERNR